MTSFQYRISQITPSQTVWRFISFSFSNKLATGRMPALALSQD